jgi:hypothetical protein
MEVSFQAELQAASLDLTLGVRCFWFAFKESCELPAPQPASNPVINPSARALARV